MGVTVGRRVDVDVQQSRPALGMRELETGLLLGLTKGRVVRQLASLEVATGLHPTTEALVQVEDRPSRPGDYRRSGHVDRTRLLVERAVEPVELEEDPLLR